MLDKLTQLEIQEVEKIREEEKERFKIENIEQVNWVLRKIRAYKKQIEQNNSLADQEIERINGWREKENRSAQHAIEFFQGLIEEYFFEMKKKDKNFKISTPYGKVSARKQQSKWHYDDEKLVNWLLQNDKELVRTKYEPDKNGIKKKYKVIGINVVTEDGEIVEGITIEERPERVVIKTD